jgi:Zn-dependent protease with chaperone function
MRALRPGALPSDTSTRFLLVLAAVTSASLYLFAALWLLFRGTVFVDAVARCAEVSGQLVPELVGASWEQLRAAQECRSAVSNEQAGVQVLGVLLVLLVGYVGYRAWPIVVQRRERLSPPVPADSVALLDEVDEVSRAAGIEHLPELRLDATNTAVAGFAYGTRGRPRLGLTGGLVVAQVLDRPVFRAVLRHELGHLAERDVPWTYYAASVWWAFLGVAVVPVTVLFSVRDLDYLLRLGWRTAALAALVALTVAALLRVREAYADARAAGWGSGPELDRLLREAPERRTRRPVALRTHPTNAARRALLANPDGLFTASGWAALAAGVAAGTAQLSITDVAALVAPTGATGFAALLVAPLLAALVCVSAWRVGLLEAVRGRRVPAGRRLGLGLGLGLAVGPVLSVRAATGGLGVGPGAWVGYGQWVLLEVAVTWLLVAWLVDAARLRVAAALAEPAGPRRALIAHVVVASAVLALWLATSAQLLVAFTAMGSAAWQLAPVLVLVSESALVAGLGALPLLLVAALLVQPLGALRLAGRPWQRWSWGDARPTSEEPGPPRLQRPRVLATCLVVGGAAGLVGGSAALGAFLAGAGLDERTQGSDDFLVAVAEAIGGGLTIAAVGAGVAAAIALPRPWWPLGLLASLAAVAVAGVVAWLTMTAFRYGLVGVGGIADRPLGWAATRAGIVDPALRALVPAALATAVVGVVRPGRAAVTAAAPAAPSSGPGPARRAALAAVGGVVATAVLVSLPVLAVRDVAPLAITAPGYSVVVPPTWQAGADPATGSARFVTIAGDLAVDIAPVPAGAAADLGETIAVGGREAVLVERLQDGAVLWQAYRVQAPAGSFVVLVRGTPRAIAQRQEELTGLLGAVRWTDPGA